MTRIARIPRGPKPRRSSAKRSADGARSAAGASTAWSGDFATSLVMRGHLLDLRYGADLEGLRWTGAPPQRDQRETTYNQVSRILRTARDAVHRDRLVRGVAGHPDAPPRLPGSRLRDADVRHEGLCRHLHKEFKGAGYAVESGPDGRVIGFLALLTSRSWTRRMRSSVWCGQDRVHATCFPVELSAVVSSAILFVAERRQLL